MCPPGNFGLVDVPLKMQFAKPAAPHVNETKDEMTTLVLLFHADS